MKKRLISFIIEALAESVFMRSDGRRVIATAYSFTLVEYSPVRVSMVINSPSSMNGGTRRT